MASRLRQRDCDSDSDIDIDIDSDIDIYSEDGRNGLNVGYVSIKVIRNQSRYLEETHGGDSKTTTSDNDESDDEKRVVVPAKNKRFQEMSDTVEKVKEPEEPKSGAEKADVLDRSDHGDVWLQKYWKKDENFMKNASQLTWDAVNKKLKETVAMRGKKGTGRMNLVEQLTFLSRIAQTSAQKLEILMNVVSAQFDVNHPSFGGHMPLFVWKKCVHNMFVILDILSLHSSIVVDDDTVEPEKNETQKNPYHDEDTIRVRGDLLAFFETLESEFFKILQGADRCTFEYLVRLEGKLLFLALAQNLQQYFLTRGNLKAATKVALKSVEFVHYKSQEVYNAMKKFSERSEGTDEGKDTTYFVITPQVVLRKPSFPECIRVFMDNLITFINRFGDERSKARAKLCDIYHLALMDDFSIARDLMLESHLQDTIHLMDISTQILFNRALAQLGLSAFRNGLIADGHSCLSELYSTGRARELLGQGPYQSWFYKKTSEQEMEERRQRVPYHMYIDLNLLQAVYLTCIMLLEVPYAAANSFTSRCRVKSKTLCKALVASEKQTLNGPSDENVRDHVVAATNALYQSDFQKAFDVLTSLTVWKLLRNKETVFEMLKYNMKEVALKAYLHICCASHCCSTSLDRMSKMFDLSESKIISIVNNMMFAKELRALWDQSSRCIVFNEVAYTRLQAIAFRLAEHLSGNTRNNERAMEVKLVDGTLDGLPLMRNEGSDYTEVVSAGSAYRSLINNAYSQWKS